MGHFHANRIGTHKARKYERRWRQCRERRAGRMSHQVFSRTRFGLGATMGAEQSGLAQALADLKLVEESSRKGAKKSGKKDGGPVFENGVWQDALHRFVASVPIWVEVRGPLDALDPRSRGLIHVRLYMYRARRVTGGSRSTAQTKR